MRSLRPGGGLRLVPWTTDQIARGPFTAASESRSAVGRCLPGLARDADDAWSLRTSIRLGGARLPRISLRCTDLPPVPAARQLRLAADSDRPQAEAAKARSGPERVLPSYSPCSDPRDREKNSSRFRPVSSGVLNLRKGMNRRSGSPGDLRNRSDSAAIGIGSVGHASRTRRRCSAAVKTPSAGGGTLRV